MGDASDFHPSETSRGLTYRINTGEKVVPDTYSQTASDWRPYEWPTSPYMWHYESSRCKYCDGKCCATPEQCPRVKSVTYFKDGAIAKIEFHKVD